MKKLLLLLPFAVLFFASDYSVACPCSDSDPVHASGYTTSNHTAYYSSSAPSKPTPKVTKTVPRERDSTVKRKFMRQTGYPLGRKGYVVNYIVSITCGGKDDPSNMQWQTVEEAKDKRVKDCRQ